MGGRGICKRSADENPRKSKGKFLYCTCVNTRSYLQSLDSTFLWTTRSICTCKHCSLYEFEQDERRGRGESTKDLQASTKAVRLHGTCVRIYVHSYVHIQNTARAEKFARFQDASVKTAQRLLRAEGKGESASDLQISARVPMHRRLPQIILHH